MYSRRFWPWDIPTEIPRVGFTFETIFTPFAPQSEPSASGDTGQELARTSIRENSPQVEIELNLELFRPDDTGGWVGSHFDIVDKISPAERPQDTSSYTHKLNFELDTAVLVFNWLPDGNWLRNMELEGSLDYVATGLPRIGDRIDDELFLDNASGWSFFPGCGHSAGPFAAVILNLGNRKLGPGVVNVKINGSSVAIHRSLPIHRISTMIAVPPYMSAAGKTMSRIGISIVESSPEMCNSGLTRSGMSLPFT